MKQKMRQIKQTLSL